MHASTGRPDSPSDTGNRPGFEFSSARRLSIGVREGPLMAISFCLHGSARTTWFALAHLSTEFRRMKSSTENMGWIWIFGPSTEMTGASSSGSVWSRSLTSFRDDRLFSVSFRAHRERSFFDPRYSVFKLNHYRASALRCIHQILPIN